MDQSPEKLPLPHDAFLQHGKVETKSVNPSMKRGLDLHIREDAVRIRFVKRNKIILNSASRVLKKGFCA
jgi:hypothetical protein